MSAPGALALTAADLLTDCISIGDTTILLGGFALVHIHANIRITSDATETTNDCYAWSGSAFALLAAAWALTLLNAVVRNYYVANRQPLFGSAVPLGYYAVWSEFVVGAVNIATGFYLLCAVKPHDWGVALHQTGCDMFSSPPSLLVWVVGEALAPLTGVRLTILATLLAQRFGPVGMQDTCAGLSFLLMAAVGVGLVLVAWLVIDPWFDDLPK
jgi:hypothetical protein